MNETFGSVNRRGEDRFAHQGFILVLVFNSFWNDQWIADIANQKLESTDHLYVLRFNHLKLLSHDLFLLRLSQDAAQGYSTRGKVPLWISVPYIYTDHPIEHILRKSPMLRLHRLFVALISNIVAWIKIKFHFNHLLISPCHQALLIWRRARLQISQFRLLLLKSVKLCRKVHLLRHFARYAVHRPLESHELYIDFTHLFIFKLHFQFDIPRDPRHLRHICMSNYL